MRTIWLSLLLCTTLAAVSSQASAAESRARQILDRFEHANQWRDHVMVAAHRAGSMQAGKTLYAENSLAAVEGSIAMGAEIVEVDIRRSKDGEFVVMHDSWLDRTTTCKGEVVEHTLAELKACRLVPWYDSWLMGLPLSTASSLPGPETEKLTVLLAVGTKLPFASRMSVVT